MGPKKKSEFVEDLEYIMAARKHGVCGHDQREKCKLEYGEWYNHNCGNCPKTSERGLSVYTDFLFTVMRLQRAGCPVSTDALSLQQWLDLADLKDLLSSPVSPPSSSPSGGKNA